MFYKSKNQPHQRIRPNKNQYEILEDRKLLAVSSVFELGELTINLDAPGDVAFLTEIDGEVMLNGEPVDMNSVMDGIQSTNVEDVAAINFVGADGLTDLSVVLNGFFNTGQIQSLSLSNINQVELNGSYFVGQLMGQFVGDGGAFSGDGQLRVSADVDVQSDDDFDFVWNNQINDFSGPVSIQTGGDISLFDASGNLVLNTIDARNMTLEANGTITDTADAVITVPGASDLTANVVNLGNGGGLTDLFAVISNTESTFSLNENDSFVWSNNSTVGFANIRASEFVTMGPNANINILSDAIFDVGRLRLGVGGSNTFNAERINFNTVQNAFVWENSSMVIFGDNNSADIDLFSLGDISNVAGTSINVEGISSFQTGGTVSIGTAAGDIFNSGEIRFFGGDFNLSENSDLVIGGLANQAENLFVESIDGSITDTSDSYVRVFGNATFLASGLGAEAVIGDSDQDQFSAGGVSFDIAGDFVLVANGDTNIESIDGFVNTANNVDILAENGGMIFNDVETTVNVTNNARLRASGIFIGQNENDNIQFGTLTVNTPGNANIGVDGDIALIGTSSVGGDLALNAIDGSVSDETGSFLTVTGQTTLVGPNGIEVGDQLGADDLFVTGTLRFFSSGGEVSVTTNSDMILVGTNNAGTARLETAGVLPFDITNQISDEDVVFELNVANSLFLTSNSNIDLGSGEMDLVNFDNLNFSAEGDVAITALFENEEDELFIFGTDNNPNVANEFRLTTNVDVFDGNNAVVMVDEFFRIEARNIILGDSDDDCLLIPLDSEFVTSDEDPQVEIDLSCPGS